MQRNTDVVGKFQRGDLVVAVRDLDYGGNVKTDTLGVVYEEAGFYDADSGPAVRWFDGQATEIFDGDVVSPDEIHN